MRAPGSFPQSVRWYVPRRPRPTTATLTLSPAAGRRGVEAAAAAPAERMNVRLEGSPIAQFLIPEMLQTGLDLVGIGPNRRGRMKTKKRESPTSRPECVHQLKAKPTKPNNRLRYGHLEAITDLGRGGCSWCANTADHKLSKGVAGIRRHVTIHSSMSRFATVVCVLLLAIAIALQWRMAAGVLGSDL